MISFKQQIVSINLDGRHDRLLKLEELIRLNEPIVCLLQDVPKLSKTQLMEACKIIARHYRVTFDQSSSERHKKVDNLILTHRERVSLRNEHTFNSNNSKATAIGVSITCIADEDDEEDKNDDKRIEYGKLVIFSVYIRPRAVHQETKACLEWITDTAKHSYGHSRTIVMGDMNAAEPTWCPIEDALNNKENSDKHYNQIKLVRGRLIAKHFNRMHMTCLNRIELGPTYKHAQGGSYIDLAFVGTKAIRVWQKISLRELWTENGHKVLTIEAQSHGQVRYRKRTYKRTRIELLNEALFEEAHLQCDSLCINWKQLPRERIIKRMDRITEVLYRVIRLAQLKITTRVTRKLPTKRDNQGKGVLNARIRRKINRLSKNQSRIMKVRHKIRRAQNTKMSVALQRDLETKKRILKKKGAMLRKSIINSMNTNHLTEQFGDLTNTELWDKIHLAENIIDSNDQDLQQISNNSIRSQDDIDELARAKFPHKDRITLDYVKDAYDHSTGSIRIKVTDEEIMTAASELRNKHYTSSEGIKMGIFFRSIEYVSNIIKALIEMSFWISYIPRKARLTQGTLIPKKAAGQFRIVHVSSPMAALLELIALKRLEYRLETSKLNSPYQFGFSALVSRHDLMARIMEFFYKNYLKLGNKASGMIISLDIEGAFDNVNQDMLVSYMDTEFGNDPVKYWIASFILNRRISIKLGNLKSATRDICLGVPQGSALGPILWNYMIHNIDHGIAKPGEIELIRYADDIIVIYNGNDKSLVQLVLDKLVDQLNRLDLNIRPEKCLAMGIRLGTRDQRKSQYYIKGTPITTVKRMNILGIPVTNKLKLDRNSTEHIQKLNTSIKKLHSINRLGIINTAQEWRILIESYIKSRLVINNWPVLILDKNSCKWVDEQIIKALKVIFNWPNNVSIKLIKLITRVLDCKETVMRTARLRVLSEFKEVYEFLVKISEEGAMQRILATPMSDRRGRGLLTKRINLEVDIIRRRKHPDPTKLLIITESENFQEIVERSGSTWIVLDRSMGSMLAEISEELEVLQFKLGRHLQYPISYFNSFALILKIVTDRTCGCRSLTLSETNSILGALENPHNRDWRVIQLRERIWDNGWKINKIGRSEERRLRDKLAEKYKGVTLRHDMNTICNDFDLWLAMNERATEEPAEVDTRPVHRVESLGEPYLMDYRLRNILNKKFAREDSIFFQRCHTSITGALTINNSIWQSLTPNWLDGSRMLILSGMTGGAQGQLVFGDREPSDTCQLCANQQDNDNHGTNRTVVNNWHGIDRERIRANLVLHKTFACGRFHSERLEFLRKAGVDAEAGSPIVEGNKTLEETLSSRTICQKFLSFMVKCNMTVI